jgi:tetratricopeptide (TPR) repeat protein
MNTFHKWGVLAGVLALMAGCATVDTPPETVLQSSAKPAWSFKATPAEMIVDVSPAGDTLRIAGTAGMVVGTGADAVVNSRYRGPIRDALEGYDAASVFQDKLDQRLEAAIGPSLERVPTLGSTAGVDSRRDAIELRHERLAGDGYSTVLDLDTSYGIFGAEGTMAVKIDGKLIRLEDTKTMWDNAIAVSTNPVLADARLQDPTRRMGYNITNPELTVDGDMVLRWTEDGGAMLKQRFEQTADAAISALLCDLGLVQEAVGEYYLGTLAMNRKDFDEAEGHFADALSLNPDSADTRNARAVNRWHNKDRQGAVNAMQQLAADEPDYGPAHYNLAHWLAVELDRPGEAEPHYDRARALGMPPSNKIEKAIEKNKN